MAYLYTDGADADAFVYKLTAALNTLYVTFDIYLCQTQLDFETPFAHDYFDFWDLYGAAGHSPVFPPNLWTQPSGGGDGQGITVTSGDWTVLVPLEPATAGPHTISFQIDLAGDILVVTIDGTVHDLSGHGYLAGFITQIDAISFGADTQGLGSGPAAVTNLTNITAGTSAPGSTDIVSDDFSGGDFSHWDGTIGRCYILDAPFCASGYQNPTLVFDGDAASRTT